MNQSEMNDCLERGPVIAAVHENGFEAAIKSPVEVIFCLKSNLITVKDEIITARAAGKHIFIHIDLAEGIGKDRTGIEYLYNIGADGIISTRGQLIRFAKEIGLLTVQRFFAVDSQGLNAISGLTETSAPDMVEIMPGVIGKVIERFSRGGIPVIAGGLIETKSEVTEALNSGAAAVSTGKSELWYI